MHHLLVPPTFFLLALAAMAALHRLAPLGVLIPRPWHLLGGVAALLGLALGAWAIICFRGSHTTPHPFGQPTALVVSGPYRITRNPMYLGLVLLLVGAAIVLGTVSPWLVIPWFVWILSTSFVRGEEKMMGEVFGGRYGDYCRRVRRWI